MKRVLGIGVLVLSLPLLFTDQATAQTNRVGTWKLNVEKSKFQGTARKSETRTYALAADGAITLTANTVFADGSTDVSSYTAKDDGKDYPYKGRNGDTISIKSTDAYTTASTVKKGGKVSQTTIGTLSKDGKTLTLVTNGTDLTTGKPVSNTRVYDKM
jgi:hypothetical protein